MKEKIKKILQFLLNPRLIFCFGIAWMITNGWAYVFLGIGTWLGIGWMAAVGGAWLTLLWIPMTPEKIVTVAISIALLRWLFPRDEKTLKILRNLHAKAKQGIQNRKAKK